MSVVLETLSEAQRQSWLSLLEVAKVFPTGWCLVGGQMVHLFCAERNFTPVRPTDDGDVALDVRAHPHILADFTQILIELGFAPSGASPEGHQHRWVRASASLDLLVPQDIGTRAAGRTGATGGTTIESPGAQQALARSEEVTVRVAKAIGVIRRPNLLGALVSKAAAYSVPVDRHKQRHMVDFAALAAITRRSDQIARQLTARDHRYLVPMIAALESSRGVWSGMENAARGIHALAGLLGTSGTPGNPPSPQSGSPSSPLC
ncbi:MAG: hypothetical protein ACRDWV_04410 [Acidimicrobiales bacterium]